MLYAPEVVDLMGAYPGREFRMVEIVRYATHARPLDLKARRAARKAVMRVLEALASSGVVLVKPPTAVRGGYAKYQWRPERG